MHSAYTKKPGSLFLATLLIILGAMYVFAPAASAAAGSISGTVTDFNTSLPVGGVNIDVYSGMSYVSVTYSDLVTGQYTVNDLVDGQQYRLTVRGYDNYIIKFYNNAKYFKDATLVTATGAGTPGIDFALRTGATSISGTATDAITEQPVANCTVSAIDSSYNTAAFNRGIIICGDTTDAQGRYSLGGLDPSANYKVDFQKMNAPWYNWQYYEDSVVWDEATLARGNQSKVDVTLWPPGWYLAEGTTAWGFSDYISIQNPNDSATSAKITYMPTGSANVTRTVNLPASSQTTINPADVLGEKDFSTLVQGTDNSKPIAVDRTMSWTGQGAASPEGHSSVGVTEAEKTWYLAEGSSAWGFECWLLIQNPGSSDATCEVTYMIEGVGPRTVTHEVPEHSRATFNMAEDIGNHDASIKVSSDEPVIAERAMYKDNRREGHESIGTPAPSSEYYLPEGTTAWGFTEYVLVQNPQGNPTDITITYMTPSGPKVQPKFSMPANSRKTIRVNDIPDVSNTDLSTMVEGSQPIIAERAMYWGAGSALGEACHDSIGVVFPCSKWLLPDGQTSGGRETWTLVQNPNDTEVTVEITYMTPTGKGNSTFETKVPANSRRTFNMADRLPDTRAAILVECKTTGKNIMVERAMYWNSRGAGTDTIGGGSFF